MMLKTTSHWDDSVEVRERVELFLSALCRRRGEENGAVQPAVKFGQLGGPVSTYSNESSQKLQLSVPSRPQLLPNSPYAAPVSPSVPTPSPLRLMKSYISDIITFGMEAAVQIRSITDGNALQ